MDILDTLRHAVILRAKAQITSDALRHVFAARPHENKDGVIRSYGDLHDYVDANYYGGAFEDHVVRALAMALHLDPTGDDTFGEVVQQFFNPMQDVVNTWILDGGFTAVLEEVARDGEEVTATMIHALAAGLPVTDANIEEAFTA